LPFLDAVGRYPEGPGSEETYRRTVNEPPGAAGPHARGRASTSAAPLPRTTRLLARRARLHIAGLAALGLIVLLALALPFRTVRIAVDGTTLTTHSRSMNENAIVAQAGITLRPGDRVATQDNGALAVQRAADVTLSVDGKTYLVRARSETIVELLAKAGVALGADDSVLRNGVFVTTSASVTATAGGGIAAQPLAVEVRRAVPFSVVENGQELQLRSSRGTIATALRDVGVRLGAGDHVQPPLDTQLTAGLQVHVDHARELLVTLPEGKSTVYSIASTVGEALTDSGVPLPADYRVEPLEDTLVSAGLAVHVIGVSQAQELETERIQSYVVYEPDPTLPRGAQRVVEGQDGVHYRQYQVVAEDGALVSRELAAEWYDPEPIDTFVYYGTAPAAVPATTGDWQDLVCSYDWDCTWATAVMMCESGGNPDAYNPQGYVGLFQIWEGFGANLRDPATNIAAAYSLYQSGGPGNWPNCP